VTKLSSLDKQNDDVRTAWAKEISRRAGEVETDEDEEDWRSALNDIRREVLSR